MPQATNNSHYSYHTRSRFGVLHPDIADACRYLRTLLPHHAAEKIIDRYDGMEPAAWRRAIADVQKVIGANALQQQRQAALRSTPGNAELLGGSPGDRGRGGCDPTAQPTDALSNLIDDPKSSPQQIDDPTTDTIEDRVERYAKFREQALAQATHLDTIDPETETAAGHDTYGIADALRRCGSHLVFRRYDAINENRLQAGMFCQNGRLCAFCSMRRMVRKVARLAPLAYQAIKDTGTAGYLVTLTVRNGADLLDRLTTLRDSDRRLHERGKRYREYLDGRRRRRVPFTEWHKVIGQLWSIEIKQGGNSNLWHPHMHSLCLCTHPIDKRALSKEWHELTGDSFIVDVRPLHAMADIERGATADEVRHQLGQDLMEVISYALKFSTMGPANTWHAYKACYGKQLSRCRGALYGLNVKDEYLDAPIETDDLPYVEVIARWAAGRYHLEAGDDWSQCSHAATSAESSS